MGFESESNCRTCIHQPSCSPAPQVITLLLFLPLERLSEPLQASHLHRRPTLQSLCHATFPEAALLVSTKPPPAAFSSSVKAGRIINQSQPCAAHLISHHLPTWLVLNLRGKKDKSNLSSIGKLPIRMQEMAGALSPRLSAPRGRVLVPPAIRPGLGLAPPARFGHTGLCRRWLTSSEWQALRCGLIRPPPRQHISINSQDPLACQWVQHSVCSDLTDLNANQNY